MLFQSSVGADVLSLGAGEKRLLGASLLTCAQTVQVLSV